MVIPAQKHRHRQRENGIRDAEGSCVGIFQVTCCICFLSGFILVINHSTRQYLITGTQHPDRQ